MRPVRPYSITQDGDLWSIADNFIQARGPHSIHVVKTKGHAYEDPEYMRSIRNDTAKLAEAKGNFRADQIADGARTEFFNPNVLRLAQMFCQRLDDYANFMRGVHSIIARTYIAAQNLKSSPAFLVRSPELVVPKSIKYEALPIHHDLPFAPLRFK
eukprot:10975377-Karenia_brevis.AAC.1